MGSLLPTFLLFLLPFLVFGQNYSECGISYNPGTHGDELVINGIPAKLGEWPWAVGVNLYTDDVLANACSGSIIDSNWVLTAAHCCLRYNGYKVGIKTLSLNDAILVDVINAISASNFDFSHFGSDICLLELAEPLTFDNETTPVCLSRSSGPEFGEILTVTGFGQFEVESKNGSGILREGTLPVGNCSNWQMPEDLKPPEPDCFCTFTSHQSAFYGDSGAPLVAQSADSRWVQAGIVSGGQLLSQHDEDGNPRFQGVHTIVEYYCDWIEENTRGEVVCGD